MRQHLPLTVNPSPALSPTADRRAVQALQRLLSVAGQVALLLLLNTVGEALVDWAGLPFPGTVVGLILLFAGLALGIIRLSWVEKAGALLTRHLAFFFIPIAVGLMTFGELILSDGPALLIALMVSAAIGIAVTVGVAQACASSKHTSTAEQ